MLWPTLLAALLAAPAKPVVSVLSFEIRSTDPELQVLGKGMADMIITDLVAWDGVTVVERQRLDAVLDELKLQRAKSFDPATTVKVGKLVGAQYAITGSLLLQQDQLRIDAAVTHIERGETVASASATDSKDRVFDLEQQLVEKLVAAIDERLKGSSARQQAKVPSFEALVAYSKAIDLSDQGKHDEASKAMAALVSKSPTFVMARDQKKKLLERLQEYEAKKKDLVSAAVLEVGKRADRELAKPFEKKSAAAKQAHLLWRVLKGRYLMRVLKQSLSFRGGKLRVVKPGQEAQALAVLRQWVENQRALISECPRECGSDPDLAKLGLYELVRDSGLATDRSIRIDPERSRRDLLELIVDGEADDGDSFDVAPPLGAFDPKETERALDENARELEQLEARWRKAGPTDRPYLENDVIQLALLRGELLEGLRRDDEAAVAYQKVLDLFPMHSQTKRAEERIQKIIGAVRDSARASREEYEGVLRGKCEDLYVSDEVRYRLRRQGLPGVEQLVQEIEAVCLGRYGLEQKWDSFYASVARTFADHEDCARARRAHLKHYLYGSWSTRSFEGLAKQQPWCSFGLSESAVPPKVRLRVDATYARDRLHGLTAALEELLQDELSARGLVVGDVSSDVPLRLELARAEGGELALTLKVMRYVRDEKSIRGDWEGLGNAVTAGGRIDVEALFQPVLREQPRSPEPVSWKPSATLALKTVEAYADALELYRGRKWADAKAAFDALATAEPALHGPKARSGMAAEKLAREKR